jgi:general secretion pathway protein E/type IV pilus assembly protein PilB
MNAVLRQMIADGMLDEQRAGCVQSRVDAGDGLDAALRSESQLAEEALLDYLAGVLGMHRVDLRTTPPDPQVLGKLPARLLLAYNLLPLSRQNGSLKVATSRPLELLGVDELRAACGCEIDCVLAPQEEIVRCLNGLLGVGADTLEVLASETAADLPAEADDVELDAAAQDASIITFVNQVLMQGIERRATDVHIEPFETSLRVRFRIDGILQEMPIPRDVNQFHASIISRLKILAHLDIAEKRVPQDGRVKLRIASREVDVRVSIIPMLHGEAAVLRLLDRSAPLLGLEHLGMSSDDRHALESVLELPHGIVLVTGPTGSGKTTTLYGCLNEINEIERKIITIEDPIEYHLHGINQIQVSTKAGLTFARGLRSILRHDPDVVLVGEIRDEETAEIAVQASLTGHLVFSTLHTNDAPSAAIRLVDMNVEPYLVASSVEVVLAQRLVRTICEHCKETYLGDLSALRQRLGDDLPEQFVRGRGCEACGHTGYQGRVGIFEIMPVSEAIRALVLERGSASVIRRQAVDDGMRTLRHDGMRLVREGRTTIDEVMRVTKDELREETRS